MQAPRRKVRFEMKWNRIPRVRRHLYVYVLLTLSAVVGNNISQAFSEPSDETPNQMSSSNIDNMKVKTNLLYK
jgi:hypothetical protein